MDFTIRNCLEMVETDLGSELDSYRLRGLKYLLCYISFFGNLIKNKITRKYMV